jgi:hypothetical protein
VNSARLLGQMLSNLATVIFVAGALLALRGIIAQHRG